MHTVTGTYLAADAIRIDQNRTAQYTRIPINGSTFPGLNPDLVKYDQVRVRSVSATLISGAQTRGGTFGLLARTYTTTGSVNMQLIQRNGGIVAAVSRQRINSSPVSGREEPWKDSAGYVDAETPGTGLGEVLVVWEGAESTSPTAKAAQVEVNLTLQFRGES